MLVVVLLFVFVVGGGVGVGVFVAVVVCWSFILVNVVVLSLLTTNCLGHQKIKNKQPTTKTTNKK